MMAIKGQVPAHIKPKQMEQTLIEVMGLLKEKKETVISFDGKSLKGTLDEQAGKRAVHLLYCAHTT